MSLTKENDDLLVKLWSEGKTVSEIADALGLGKYQDKGKSAVCGLVKRKRDAAKKACNRADELFWTRTKRKKSASPRLQKLISPWQKRPPKGAPRPKKVRDMIEGTPPAKLKANLPIYTGAAFLRGGDPRKDPDAFTQEELRALGSLWESA